MTPDSSKNIGKSVFALVCHHWIEHGDHSPGIIDSCRISVVEYHSSLMNLTRLIKPVIFHCFRLQLQIIQWPKIYLINAADGFRLSFATKGGPLFVAVESRGIHLINDIPDLEPLLLLMARIQSFASSEFSASLRLVGSRRRRASLAAVIMEPASFGPRSRGRQGPRETCAGLRREW